MTKDAMKELQKVTEAFRDAPSPEAATNLLLVLGPRRKESPSVQEMIDYALEYLYLVGTVSSKKEAADNQVDLSFPPC
jgi:hypothetical protein